MVYKGKKGEPVSSPPRPLLGTTYSISLKLGGINFFVSYLQPITSLSKNFASDCHHLEFWLHFISNAWSNALEYPCV